MKDSEVDIVQYSSEDEVCEVVVPAGASQEQRAAVALPSGAEGVGGNVSATLNECTDAQFGPKFVAEYMTFMLPDSIAKGDSVVSKIIKERFDVECTKSDKTVKTNTSRYIIGFFLVLLFLVIFMCYISIQTLENREKLNSLESKQYAAPTDDDVIVSATETINVSDVKSKIFNGSNVSITPPIIYTRKSTNTIINQNKSYSTSSEDYTITTNDNLLSNQEHANKTNSTIIDKRRPTNTTNKGSHNTSILILQHLTLSFDVYRISLSKYFYNNPVRGFKKIDLEFFRGPCTGFPECLKYLAYYPNVDYNFILHSGGMVVKARGWEAAQTIGDSIGILLVFRDTKIISEKIMYLYLLLINSALRCGYLDRQFNIKIVNNKYFRNSAGIDKFVNIINRSTEERFLVDDKDRFIADSITLGNKTQPVCGFRSECGKSCTNHKCLQSVCASEGDCYVQCV